MYRSKFEWHEFDIFYVVRHVCSVLHSERFNVFHSAFRELPCSQKFRNAFTVITSTVLVFLCQRSVNSMPIGKVASKVQKPRNFECKISYPLPWSTRCFDRITLWSFNKIVMYITPELVHQSELTELWWDIIPWKMPVLINPHYRITVYQNYLFFRNILPPCCKVILLATIFRYIL